MRCRCTNIFYFLWISRWGRFCLIVPSLHLIGSQQSFDATDLLIALDRKVFDFFRFRKKCRNVSTASDFPEWRSPPGDKNGRFFEQDVSWRKILFFQFLSLVKKNYGCMIGKKRAVQEFAASWQKNWKNCWENEKFVEDLFLFF